jgi:tetratricopeptide (TPR) repeat protein
MRLAHWMLPAVCLASAAVAEPGGEIGYPKGSLGYDALVSANYSAAERQILSDSRIAKNDPARLINLGQVYAKTGRTAEAIRVLEQAMRAEDIELILANGEVVGSREAARKALALIVQR